MNKTEAENRGLNKELFKLICKQYDSQACHQTIGLKITYLGKGVAGMKKSPDLNFSTDGGRAHGGVLATLADTVMGAAAFTTGQFYRTLEMSLNYLAPAFEETELTAEGRVIHPGKTVALVEGSLFNKEGKLIVKSKGTYFRDTKSSLTEENRFSISS